MTAPLMLFLAATLIAAFFGRIRSAPFWLAVQALALAWIMGLRHAHDPIHALPGVVEVLLLRAVIAPWWLHRALARRQEPNRDLIPSNLFAWTAAVALIAMAFKFGAPQLTGGDALTLGVVAATVVSALLLLALNAAPFVQLVALIFIENAIALFESLMTTPWPLTVHVALSAVYLLIVLMGCRMLGSPQART